MRKLIAFLLLFLVTGMILVGCGGDSESDDAGASADGNTAVGDPATEEAQELVGDPEAGKTQFESVCSACHGPDAKGLPNLGKDLTTSEFARGLTDAELVEFVKTGRSVSDPANTTGVDMPPKGGNPAFSDQNLYDIVAYIRTLEE